MKRTSLKFALIGAAALLPAIQAQAIDYKWNVLGGGTQPWLTPTNWTPNGVPNTIIDVAGLSVPLTANLNVDVDANVITLAGLDIGGTGAAVTTDIVGVAGVAGGKIIFSSNDDADFNNNGSVDGDDFLIWQRGLGGAGSTNATGDANGDGFVDAADLRAWRQGAVSAAPVGPPAVFPSRAVINSTGAAGTINTISVPVRSGVSVGGTPAFRSESVEIRGTTSLTFAGGYRISGGFINPATAAADTIGNADNVLTTFLPQGATLTINGIVLEEDTEAVPDTNRSLNITNSHPTDGGRIELTGPISGGGGMTLGTTSPTQALATWVISGTNSLTGSTLINRGTFLLASDTAFGTGADLGTSVRTGNPGGLGFNILSDNDAREIRVRLQIPQYFTFRGENSLTVTGVTVQTNGRGLINLLPEGKTLTLAGNVYGRNSGDSRIIVFDGSGKTVVTGAFKNLGYNTGNPVGERPVDTLFTSLNKQGQGSLHLNGEASYLGVTTVSGGNLHFGLFDENIATPSIVAHFGAVGGDAYSSFGVPDTMQTNLLFLGRIHSVSTGGIMLSASNATESFDFVGGPMNGLPNMSLAAPETGLSFTGSITPANSTYRLGGGAGTLTLPNATLTGANSLVVTNGGVVQLNGANTYSGITSVIAKYTPNYTTNAINNSSAPSNIAPRILTGTVLGVNNLAVGGSSSIGSSSNVASNLVIQGSTVRYTGGGQSTDRLFTVGTGGATLESSGGGAINFTNTGALAMDEPESRSATKSSATLNGVTNVDDLVVGMGVNGPGIPANATISSINYPIVSGALPLTPLAITVTISANATNANTDTLNFTSIARTLTLGGANVGDNTLRPNIVNGAAATSVAKADAGKWILTGTNTYTGTTTVNGGTLLVNGTHTGGGAYTVASGATLGGAGTIAAAITNNGVLSPGNSLSAGALTVTGGVTFNAGSTLLIEIGPTAGQFDELNLVGVLAAGGTFDVDLLSGFVPSIGQSFDVLDFTSATGTFTFSLPALPVGRVWNTANVLTTGTIGVVAGVVGVPEPSSLLLAAGCMAALAVGRSRRLTSATR